MRGFGLCHEPLSFTSVATHDHFGQDYTPLTVSVLLQCSPFKMAAAGGDAPANGDLASVFNTVDDFVKQSGGSLAIKRLLICNNGIAVSTLLVSCALRFIDTTMLTKHHVILSGSGGQVHSIHPQVEL